MSKGQNLVAVAFAVGLVSLLVWIQGKTPKIESRRKEESKKSNITTTSTTTASTASSNSAPTTPTATSTATSNNVAEAEHREASIRNADEILKELFQVKVEAAALLINLTNGDRLMLYGLYKQATVGDCTVPVEPSRLHAVAHGKYAAWKKFEGMSCSTAMTHYMQAIQHFEDGDPVTLELDDDADEDMGLYSGMGLRPSVPDDEEEEEVLDDSASLEQRLRKAAGTDDWDALQKVVGEGAQLDAMDDSGQTALHFAADRGLFRVVDYLLEHGADPNAADLEGISVLQAAVIAGQVNVARRLLEAGAHPDQEDMDGDTPRSCAEDDGSEEMKKLFTLESVEEGEMEQ